MQSEPVEVTSPQRRSPQQLDCLPNRTALEFSLVGFAAGAWVVVRRALVVNWLGEVRAASLRAVFARLITAA